MSEEKTEEQETPPQYKLSDDLIAIVRELVQISLLTGTNVIDHFRGLVVEPAEQDPEKLVPTEEYIQAYNDMVEKFEQERAKQQEPNSDDSTGQAPGEDPDNQSGNLD